MAMDLDRTDHDYARQLFRRTFDVSQPDVDLGLPSAMKTFGMTKRTRGKQCPRCKRHHTTSMLVQLRSADEPQNELVLCLDCDFTFTR